MRAVGLLALSGAGGSDDGGEMAHYAAECLRRQVAVRDGGLCEADFWEGRLLVEAAVRRLRVPQRPGLGLTPGPGSGLARGPSEAETADSDLAAAEQLLRRALRCPDAADAAGETLRALLGAGPVKD